MHSEAFRENLLCHTLGLSIDVHNLVLDNKFAVFISQHSLANAVLFLLRQDEVVLIEGRATDFLHDFVVSVTLIDQDAIGVEEKLQSHRTLILVIISYLIDGVLDHHGLHQTSLNEYSDLLDDVFEAMLLDIDLRL